MELDSFLASPRWEILKIISERPSSPIEIAEKTKTTVSFISQQLKLLEAAQLVSKEKTGAFEKGKPRNLFSISKDFFYLTILTNAFSEKKLLSLEDYQKLIIKVWSLDNTNLKYFLEEILLKIKDNISSIEGICFDKTKLKPLIIIFSDNKRTISIIQSVFKEIKENFNLECLSMQDLKKINLNEITFFHQSQLFLKEIRKLNSSEKEAPNSFRK